MKMKLPLSFSDIIFFLGVNATLLLLTSEVIASYYGQINIFVEKKRLRIAALFFCILFIIAAFLGLYKILI